MQIYYNSSLKPFHTFSINQTADVIIEVFSVEEVKDVFRNDKWRGLPKLVLGKGSNVLFTEHYRGVVIINRIMGINVREDDSFYYLNVAGGEDWPLLVEHTVKKGIAGLENLAMIPGCVGSAPVQNIGAYGLEFKDICEYVEYVNTETQDMVQLSARECQFGYRDSVFKHSLKTKAFVTSVGLKVSKRYVPLLDYGPLRSLASDSSCQKIFDVICKVRSEKLPDPIVSGNAGSFFKNPVVTSDRFDLLRQQYPDIVHYHTSNGMKLAAGWLIEQCGLKGLCIGGAKVHPKQALVLVNENNATSADVINLALHVRSQVYERYGVMLEHEVRFMGETGEVFLDKFMDSKIERS
ncbi:UDP-N-acetylmuramate dehydrogenase [Vibrio salinus]|uniref:UDP-N-acetylmuramate dehydrogenase n=1 Tax=Vibrio salinus TaxID=2899784 RepID=UPI001E6488DE|nr:UDP-N-acetylmuramate dehydrogenase [Vibrio salinus]MCE0493514.1 UDP-N-acetylmuramate dehydrogenase [Vibrio salinus]